MRRVIVGLIALLAVLALHSPAHADVRDDAGREFAAGEAADRRGDYEKALQHYMRANDLVPHPSTMFNIATNYERLGKLHEALVWFQRYVDEARTAPDRDAVLRKIRDLKARILAEPPPPTGTLRVVGPIGSQVFVDDAPIGTIPSTFDIPPGPHRVRVTNGLGEPYETTIEIYPQRDSVVRVPLSRAGGSPDPVKRQIRAGYLLGVAGGLDLRDQGPMVLVDLGVHALKYDIAARIGKANGFTAVDLVIRVALGNGRIAPYLGGGYSFTFGGDMDDSSSTGAAGGGYALIGGLRMELSRSEHAIVALVAESGMRIYGASGGNESGVMIPLMGAVQLIYK